MRKTLHLLCSCLVVFSLLTCTSACERDQVQTEVVAVYPIQGETASADGLTFKWVANGHGDYHFRLGDVDMQQIVVDTVLEANVFTYVGNLESGKRYRWEVTQGGAHLAEEFVAVRSPQFALLYPQPGTALPLTGTEFRWQCNSTAPVHFRLSKVGASNALVDTLTHASSYRLYTLLEPNVAYHWEVELDGVRSGMDLTTANVALLALLEPAQGADVPPCCQTQFRWTSFFAGPFRLRIGNQTTGVQLLDTAIQDTQVNLPHVWQPGESYYWEVEQGSNVLRQNFRARSLNQLYPGAIPGNNEVTHFDDVNGYTTTNTTTTINVVSLNNGQHAQVNGGTLIPIAYMNTTQVRYNYGDNQNYTRLDIYFATGQVIFEHRMAGVGWWTRNRFVSF